MNWPGPIYTGILLRRYKRFLADIRLDGGEEITAHCPNTGAMTGCAVPGSRVWLTRSDSPTRKYPFTWQCIERDGERICIHSALANALLAESLETGRVTELAAYSHYQREVKLEDGSRVDFCLQSGGDVPDCLLEVKSVALLREARAGAFPDAVSQRARRHVEALQAHCDAGGVAALFFAVLHTGIERVAPAYEIDPLYAEALAKAVYAGVQVLAYRAQIDERGMSLACPVPFSL